MFAKICVVCSVEIFFQSFEEDVHESNWVDYENKKSIGEKIGTFWSQKWTESERENENKKAWKFVETNVELKKNKNQKNWVYAIFAIISNVFVFLSLRLP